MKKKGRPAQGLQWQSWYNPKNCQYCDRSFL